MPNTELINKVIDRIESLPSEFEMASWFGVLNDSVFTEEHYDKETGTYDYDAIEEHKEEIRRGGWGIPALGTTKVPLCNTTACMAGEVIIVGADMETYLEVVQTEEVAEVALELLGLDPVEDYRHWLFYRGDWPDWTIDMDQAAGAVALLRLIREGYNPANMSDNEALETLAEIEEAETRELLLPLASSVVSPIRVA